MYFKTYIIMYLNSNVSVEGGVSSVFDTVGAFGVTVFLKSFLRSNSRCPDWMDGRFCLFLLVSAVD